MVESRVESKRCEGSHAPSAGLLIGLDLIQLPPPPVAALPPASMTGKRTKLTVRPGGPCSLERGGRECVRCSVIGRAAYCYGAWSLFQMSCDRSQVPSGCLRQGRVCGKSVGTRVLAMDRVAPGPAGAPALVRERVSTVAHSPCFSQLQLQRYPEQRRPESPLNFQLYPLPSI